MDIDEAQDVLSRTYYQKKLKAKLAEEYENGMTGFHITPGDHWNSMTKEDRAKAILGMFDYAEDIGTRIVAECKECFQLLTEEDLREHDKRHFIQKL